MTLTMTRVPAKYKFKTVEDKIVYLRYKMPQLLETNNTLDEAIIGH